MAGVEEQRLIELANGSNSSKTSEPWENSNHPLFVHHSDQPGAVLVSQPLMEDNYMTWVHSMTMALTIKNKKGFIDGTLQRSSHNVAQQLQWDRCNVLVKTWLLGAMSKDISSSVIHCKDARGMWLELQERFSHTNTVSLFHIENAIHECEQGTNSVTSFFTKLKGLWDERDALCSFPTCTCEAAAEVKKFIETQRTMKFLMGLGENFAQTRSNIIGLDPLPNLNKAYAIVLRQEKQAETTASKTTAPPESSAFSVKRVTRDFKLVEGDTKFCEKCNMTNHNTKNCRAHFKCTYCNGKGHTYDYCRRRKSATESGETKSKANHVASQNDQKEADFPFSREECHQLFNQLLTKAKAASANLVGKIPNYEELSEANQESHGRHEKAVVANMVDCTRAPEQGNSEGGNSANTSGATEISELEQMLKQRNFTRFEIEHLTELLRSRTSDLPVEDEGKREEPKLPNSPVNQNWNETDIFHESIPTPVVRSVASTASTQSAPFQFGSSTASSFFGTSGITSSTPALSPFSSSVSTSANRFSSTTTSFGQSSAASSSEAISSAATAPSIFGTGCQPSKSSVFGSTLDSSAPSTGFSFGVSSTAATTTSSSPAMVFGSSATGASSGPSMFTFGSSAATMSSFPSFSQTQPVFGNSPPVFAAPSGNNDQMGMEDSMAEDTLNSPAPAVPAFGQRPSQGFMFGSADPGPAPTPALPGVPFQFGGQPNSVIPSPFQASSSLEFNAGGSFSLGSGGDGGDKSGRRMVRVSKNKNRCGSFWLGSGGGGGDKSGSRFVSF